MIIKTEIIKKFLSESSVVKPSVVSPDVNDTIKIEHKDNLITLTKTNMNIFCTYTCKDDAFHVDDEVYLLGERSLAGIAQTTTSPTITIEQVGDLINIIGNKSERVQYPVRPLTDFPVMPQCTGETADLPSEVLHCIKVAGQHIDRDQKASIAGYVHVGANGVFGTNQNNLVYYHKFDGLPAMAIGEDLLNVIRPINGVTYATHGNYDFINYDGFSYGVIKTAVVTKQFDYMNIFSKPAVLQFEIERQKLLDFCTLAGYAAKSEYPVCTLRHDDSLLSLDHDDADFNIHVNKKLECIGAAPVCDVFNFSLKWFETFLKSLPYNTLIFSRTENHMIVTSSEDADYRGLYAGIN